jgi:glycosyltransferase involved in cell wall biosynthesis
VVVGIAGDLNASKGIEALLSALPRVRSSVRAVLVGRTSSHWDVQRAVRGSGVGDRVTVITDVRDDEFLEWLCAFDILVNLRHPHRGETSGSLVRSLHAGVPTIVSAVGTYLEVPDAVVVRIAPGPPDPVELAAAIDRLARDPEARGSMSRRARDYARSALAPRVTAEGYAEAVHRTLQLNADPVRNAIARWARGLRPAGLGPPHAARGLGVRYPEALFELRGEEPG